MSTQAEITKDAQQLRTAKQPRRDVLYTILNAIGQLVLASILWVLCCLPIITIGPACVALYYCVVKTIRRDRATIVKSFFHAFRINFKQGFWLNLLLLSYGGAVALLALPHLTSWTAQKTPDSVLYLCIGLVLLVAWIPPYLYPALSRFQFSNTQLMRFVLTLGVRHVPVTLLLLLMLIAISAFALFEPVFLVLLPALYSFLSSLLLEPIFKRYSSGEHSEEYDLWYSRNQNTSVK